MAKRIRIFQFVGELIFIIFKAQSILLVQGLNLKRRYHYYDTSLKKVLKITQLFTVHCTILVNITVVSVRK